MTQPSEGPRGSPLLRGPTFLSPSPFMLLSLCFMTGGQEAGFDTHLISSLAFFLWLKENFRETSTTLALRDRLLPDICRAQEEATMVLIDQF